MRRTPAIAALLTVLCLALSLATMSLSGCASLTKLENPTYSIRDIRPHIDVSIPLASTSLDFDCVLVVDNPNRVGLHLEHVEFDLFMNGDHVLSGISREPADIPSHGRGEVHLRASIRYSNIRTIYGHLVEAIRGNRGRYEIRGMAWYHTPFGTRSFPIDVRSGRDEG